MKKRILITSFIVILAVLLVAGAGFLLWANSPSQPMPEALAALQSNASVSVATSPWLTFTPAGQVPTVGFIFYPGWHVDARAYAPAAAAIAAQGYLVVIVPMPLNFAFFGAKRADDVVAAHPEIEYWAIGGHSLGGVMAARYVSGHPGKMQGLVLWASYPAEDLSAQRLAAVSISASLDGLVTPEKIEASRSLLPADTRFVAIEGGNHAQFGWYGPQSGDSPATLNRMEQQQRIVLATLQLLERIAAQPKG